MARAVRSARSATHSAASKTGTSGIRIKPANRGKLRATTGTPKGKKIPVATLKTLKKSTNPVTRRRATFALNARKWRHK